MKLKVLIRNLFRFSPFLVTFWWTIGVLVLCYFQPFGIDVYEMQSKRGTTKLGLHVLEWGSQTFRFQITGQLPPDERLAYISIDERSIFSGETLDEEYLKTNPDYALLKKFPYPRKVWALLAERLVQSGAKMVILDLLFPSPSSYGDDDDEAFAQVLAKYQDKIIAGVNFNEHESEMGIIETCERLHSNLIKNSSIGENVTAYVNYRHHPDGAIRAMWPLGWPYTDDVFAPSYSLDILGIKKAYPEVKLPEKYEPRYINFCKGVPEAHPLYLLFANKTWKENIPPFHQGRFFKDKIVLIGPRANSMHDFHQTPLGTTLGPDIHLKAIATLLDKKVLRDTTQLQTLLIITVLGFIYAFILPLAKSPLTKLVPAFIFGFGYLGIAQLAFSKFYLFIPLVPIEVIVIGSTCSVVTLQAVFEQMEKRRVSGMLQRYVSKNIADELIKSGQSVQSLMEPKKRTVTVLFSDVRDFTTMTESSEPGPFIKQLNEYLTEMVECVFNNHGTVDKFVGDAVMAVFGNPRSRGRAEDAWSAVKTAIDMRQRLVELNVRWAKEGRPIFRIGIGLNHGDVMSGDIGSKQKAEPFGIIGDPVNVAARVESLTKEQKVDILITDSVYQFVQDKVEVEHRGQIPVKGRGKPVEVYALKGLKENASQSRVAV
jgi:adenylate cyclase